MPPYLLVAFKAFPATHTDKRVEPETSRVCQTCIVERRFCRIPGGGEWLERRRERQLLIERVEEAVEGLKQ